MSLAKHIKKLPPEVVKKIAAGEVVERPASIVKELLDNSIDANATKIKVSVENGGTDLISISDNGSGIEQGDLKMATVLHATSKISNIDDLETILSLGFRGEALASIAAVSDLEIISLAKNASEAYKLTANNQIEPASRAQGTTITIKNLFRQIPARRKFLKTEKTEEAVIRKLVKNYALAYPGIEFNYENNQNLLLELTPETLLARIGRLYSLKESELIAIRVAEEQTDLDIQAVGYLGHPKIAKRKPNQFLTINNRVVRSGLINSAVKTGYSNFIPRDLNPEFFLQLTIDPASVDVNIHPRKEEIKFSDEKRIFTTILKIVKTSLAENMRQDFENKFSFSSEGSSAVNKNRSEEEELPRPTYVDRPAYTKPTKVADTLKFSESLLDYKPKALPQREDYSRPTYSADIARVGQKQSRFLQVFNTYIVMEHPSEDKLLLIDQHAADERIKYERLKKQLLSANIDRSPLLLPEVIEIAAEKIGSSNKALLIDNLSKLGIISEDFNSDDKKIVLKIREIPTLLQENSDIKGLISEAFLDLQKEDINLDKLSDSLDRIIATMACHSSIRAGQTLQVEKIQKIISDLWECQDPFTCPHGRPISIEIKKTDLESDFLRKK